MSKLRKLWDDFSNRLDMKKFLIMGFPYILFGYLFNKLAWLYRMSMAVDMIGKLMEVVERFAEAFYNPLPSFQQTDVMVGIVAGCFLKMAVVIRGSNAKKFRHGMEYGSARWGTPKDIEPYIDPVFENNIILTATERLIMSGRPKKHKYARAIVYKVVTSRTCKKSCRMSMISVWQQSDEKGGGVKWIHMKF